MLEGLLMPLDVSFKLGLVSAGLLVELRFYFSLVGVFDWIVLNLSSGAGALAATFGETDFPLTLDTLGAYKSTLVFFFTI